MSSISTRATAVLRWLRQEHHDAPWLGVGFVLFAIAGIAVAIAIAVLVLAAASTVVGWIPALAGAAVLVWLLRALARWFRSGPP